MELSGESDLTELTKLQLGVGELSWELDPTNFTEMTKCKFVRIEDVSIPPWCHLVGKMDSHICATDFMFKSQHTMKCHTDNLHMKVRCHFMLFTIKV